MAAIGPPVASGTALVIGYGNALRGDDGAGPAVAGGVADWGLPGVRALAMPQLVPELAEELAGASLVVFVDGWLGPEGESAQVEALTPSDRSAALGHTSDPGALLALTRAVYGWCPPAWIVRIPAANFELGVGLSPAATRGAAAALREVARLVALARPRPACPVTRRAGTGA